MHVCTCAYVCTIRIHTLWRGLHEHRTTVSYTSTTNATLEPPGRPPLVIRHHRTEGYCWAKLRPSAYRLMMRVIVFGGAARLKRSKDRVELGEPGYVRSYKESTTELSNQVMILHLHLPSCTGRGWAVALDYLEPSGWCWYLRWCDDSGQ